MFELKDKVCLVTGGAAGIGAAQCKAFLEEGAKNVAILDIDVINGKSLENELNVKHGHDRAKFFKCDVTSDLDEAYDSVIKEFGCIDLVVNTAGIFNDSPATYKKEIEINVTALITSTLKAYNLMRKDNGGIGGTVINISSIAGIHQANICPIYTATKSAVLQFSNCLGATPYYSRSGVRIITICFGGTDTSLIHQNNTGGIDRELDDEKLLNAFRNTKLQSPESAAKGTVEAYRRGESGSTWLVMEGTAKDITSSIVKAYEIMYQDVIALRSAKK